MLIGEPLQQRLAFGELLDVTRWRHLLELGNEVLQRLEHRLPVARRGAHVVQNREQLASHRVEDAGVGLAVDLDVRPRLEQHLLAVSGGRVVGCHPEQLAVVRTAYAQDRVHDEVYAEIATVERHREGVDDERHVVEHDVDRGVTACGRVDAHERFCRGAPRAESPVLQRRGCELLGRPDRQVVVAELPVIGTDERVGACGIRRIHEFADLRHHVIATGHDADHTVHGVLIGTFARSRMLATWTPPRHWSSHWSSPIWPIASRWSGSARTT